MTDHSLFGILLKRNYVFRRGSMNRTFVLTPWHITVDEPIASDMCSLRL